MAGTTNPAADPTGEVRKPLSADGSHFIFGASKKFESAGKEGSPSIYDRNLNTDTTQVVSTLENGTTMGGEVGELDVSEDGSRIVVGQKISTDAKGNEYWHLFMHIGSSPNSVDLTPGATLGALYDGMSGDGSRVFFTTKDHLLGDTDASADIYEAAVDGGGAVTLRLITTKGGVVSNDDSCLPPAFPTAGTRSPAKAANATPSRSPAGPVWPRATEPSTSPAPSCSTARSANRTRRTSTSSSPAATRNSSRRSTRAKAPSRRRPPTRW